MIKRICLFVLLLFLLTPTFFNINGAETAPQAPTFTLSRIDYRTIRISLETPSPVDGYEIYRSIAKDGDYILLGTVSDPEYIDTDLLCGQQYFYRVRSFRTLNSTRSYSPFSTVKNLRAQPKKPQPQVISQEYQSVTLSWSEVPGATDYYISRSTSPDSGYSETLITSDLTYTDIDLKHGTTYYYKIQAAHHSILSTASRITATPLCQAPSVTLEQTAYHTLTLKWPKTEGASSYTIYRSTSKNGTYTPIASITGRSYTDRDLKQGTIYYYKICAVRNSKPGICSTPIASNLYLAAPSGFKISPAGAEPSDGLLLTWKKVKGASGYTLYRSTKENSGYQKIASISSTSYIDRSTPKTASYYYRIRAVKNSVQSDYRSASITYAKDADYNLSQLTISRGKTFTPNLSVSPAAADLYSCIFTSSNPSVASIDAEGTVTTHAVGTTTLTCTPLAAPSASSSLQLTVTDAVTIVLDPGHGGHDPGAVSVFNGTNYYERDLNLKISQYTRKALLNYKGITVYLTRTTNDTYIDLKQRVLIAKEYCADLLVCQHLNSAANSSARGFEIYTSVNKNYQMTSLARLLAAELSSIGLPQRGIFSRADDDDPSIDYYGILRYSTEEGIPSILMENAFISNKTDVSQFLKSSTKLKKVAVANANAIAQYYDLSAK